MVFKVKESRKSVGHLHYYVRANDVIIIIKYACHRKVGTYKIVTVHDVLGSRFGDRRGTSWVGSVPSVVSRE